MINFTEKKKMRHFGIVMCVALFLTACGDSKPPAATGGKAPDTTQSKAAVAPKGGGEKLAVKAGGKDIGCIRSIGCQISLGIYGILL